MFSVRYRSVHSFVQRWGLSEECQKLAALLTPSRLKK